MKRLLIIAAMAICAAAFTADSAQAQQGCGGFGGFLPYGFYQPYGARYGASINTPPYFATNPPVYYGARYARPYGMSPFASPPVVTAPSSYQGRLRTSFQQKPLTNVNPHISSARPQTQSIVEGKVQTNPFVEQGSTGKFAKN